MVSDSCQCSQVGRLLVTEFGLTPEEALLGATRHAAQALGRGHSHGKLAAGCVADLLLWDIEHPAEIVYGLGTNPLKQRVFRGAVQHID